MAVSASKTGPSSAAKIFTIEVDTAKRTITADGSTRSLGSIPISGSSEWQGLKLTKRRYDGYVLVKFEGRAFELYVNGNKQGKNVCAVEFPGA